MNCRICEKESGDTDLCPSCKEIDDLFKSLEEKENRYFAFRKAIREL